MWLTGNNFIYHSILITPIYSSRKPQLTPYCKMYLLDWLLIYFSIYCVFMTTVLVFLQIFLVRFCVTVEAISRKTHNWVVHYFSNMPVSIIYFKDPVFCGFLLLHTGKLYTCKWFNLWLHINKQICYNRCTLLLDIACFYEIMIQMYGCVS